MSLPTDRSAEPLAIIGMACRLPGADNLDQYWQLVIEGQSAVSEAPADRFDQRLYYDPQKGVRGKSYSKLAAVLRDRSFDPASCPIPVELLGTVDRTHLLMTQVAADALRHARLDPFRLEPKNTAVFIGHAQGSSRLGELTYRAYIEEAAELLTDLEGFRDLSNRDQDSIRAALVERVRRRLPEQPPNARNLYCNMVSGTIAKAFGLSGGWLALNSACASSLHAMLLGARALQLGRADMAIVGGASDCKNDSLVLFSAAQTLSTCGSRPFDSEADGLVMSEGYVALVMKTLRRAIADGDPIQAVVRGLGVASDGRGKSLWAPRKEGQMKAMQRAYRSGVDMSKVQYLEAHATSTQVGDATELETLGEVLGPKFPAGKRIPITSVKANIGHTLEAAGVAGLIKTVLCMQHQMFPPAINIRQLNSKVDWNSAPYYIPMAPEPWAAQPDGSARRAAVNAFGIGGLNMHVVLDEFTDEAHQLVSTPPAKPASPDDQAVAIIGIGCVVPGASGVDKLWDLLAGGVDPKSSPPESRWTRAALEAESQRGVPTRAGFVTDFEYDWRKHKVPPKQVAEADPLQFMLLHAAEQALSDAAYDRKPIDREKCGVVVGTEFGGEFCDHLEMGLRLPEMQDHLATLLRQRGFDDERIRSINEKLAAKLLRKWPSLIDETGSFTSSTLASRITKTLDLAGGAVSIDSGSTSAMTGLAVAIDMLLSGDNDLMICAAGQRRMGPNIFDALQDSGLITPRDARNLLDAGYDGMVPGEGVAVVVLKRLADARRDGDRIHAVIRGLGLAHDTSQAQALQLAAERSFAIAGVDPAELKLVEFDTDERLSPGGDEFTSLLSTYSASSRAQPILLGSSTAQLGHLGGGSGMVALVKASLEVERGSLTPAVSILQPTPAVPMNARNVKVATGTERIVGRRFGAVACWSKGLACHLILEEGSPAPAATTRVVPPRQVVTTPSASKERTGRSEWRVCRLAAGSATQMSAAIDAALGDLQAAWKAGERPFSQSDRSRLAIVADSPETLGRKLQLARPQFTNPAARQVLEQQGVFYRELPSVRPRVAFLFPGQGSQYDGMFEELVRQSPAAAEQLRAGDEVMRRLGHPTFAELAWKTPTQLGSDVWLTQVSMLLADTIALAAARAIGLEPDVVLGHSYGEFVALYAAGVWDLETAVRMTRARCDGIMAVARGDSGMLATNAPLEVLEPLMAESGHLLYVANANAPDQTVVGGKRGQLATLGVALEQKRFQARTLSVPAAFHTPLMAGGSRLLEQQLQGAALVPPSVPVISTVSNGVVGTVADVRRNLAMQLTTPVRYCQLIANTSAEQPTVFVEIGPQQTLTRLNRRILDSSANVIACDNPKRPGTEPLLAARALLECLGTTSARVSDHPNPNLVSQGSKKEVSKSKVMHDQIPHFDATERRRTKKRSGAAAPPTARSSGEGLHAPRVPDSVQRLTAAAPSRAPSAAPSVPHKPQPPAATVPPASPPRAASAASKPLAAKSGETHHSNGSGVPADVRQQAPPPPSTSAAKGSQVARQPHELESFLINFVVEQTGYPAEVVDLDADLEADLGVDSIKKAQLFGELQEYFDVSAASSGNLSLDEFPTLRHVLNFLLSVPSADQGTLHNAKPVPASPTLPPMESPRTTPLNGEPPRRADQSTRSAAELESFLINFVVEQTGYPAEVVDLDADLEADLGVDSIKKAQLFGELQEYFDLGGTSSTNLSLDDFPTLRHVLNFLLAAEPAPSSAVSEPAIGAAATGGPVANGKAHASSEPAAAAASHRAPPPPAELESFLINFVVEQTGYPAEVVDLDADLEADLGVDSIKKAQLFGELQEYFDLGGAGATNLSLDDFPTLRHVLNFLSSASVANSADTASHGHQHSSATFTPAPGVADSQPTSAPESASGPSIDTAELETFLINFVVEQTGYPAEVVDLDADLEADLGVDSIKKAQLFGELQEYFPLSTPTAGNLSLDDFPTLRHVLEFLQRRGADGNGNAPADLSPVPFAANGHSESVNGKSVYVSGIPKAADVEARTPYEVGWIRGVQQKAEILAALQSNVDFGLSGSVGAGDLVSNCRQLTPDELDELVGMSDASEIALGNLIAYQAGLKSEPSTNGTIHLSAHSNGFNGLGSNHVHASRLGAVAASSSIAIADVALAEGQVATKLAGRGRPSVARKSLLSETSNSYADRADVVVERPPLPAPSVTTRFVMELADAPLHQNGQVEPQWHGAAIILGDDSLADALQTRLQNSGVAVHRLIPSADDEAILEQLAAWCSAGPAPHLFITTAREGSPKDPFDEQRWQQTRRRAMWLPFLVCQRWIELAGNGGWLDCASLVAATAMGGDFGFTRGAQLASGGAVAGLLKAIFIEYRIMQKIAGLQVKVIDAPLEERDDQLVDNMLHELASGKPDYEVGYRAGRRVVPVAVEQAVEVSEVSTIRRGATWVVTGGARGITAACALELGRRFGLRLHLLGSSPEPKIDPSWLTLSDPELQKLKAQVMIAARQEGRPAALAWERVQKDIEIARSLQAFVDAGIDATYHACDVSNREALADVLNDIRRSSGPIEGILHGAGIDRSCRFDRKQPGVVLQTIGAKVDGAANLMALTRRDPVRYFIGFGSISGRFGSFGQTDYCLASDMLCKLIGAYRRERPWIKAVGFHWHPWDEVGMAARPETKSILQGKSDLQLMPMAEGIAHLMREIAGGVNSAEVLVTERRHWQRFSAGLERLEAGRASTSEPAAKASPNPSQPKASPNRSADIVGPADPSGDIELRTNRRVFRTLSAPAADGASQWPDLEGPAWIVGENAAARALEERLIALGCPTTVIRPTGDLDRAIADVERLWNAAPARHLFMMTGRDELAGDLLDALVSTARRDQGILFPFFVAQRWYKLLSSRPDLGRGSLVAAVSLGGDFGFAGDAPLPDSGAIDGLLKAVHIEDSRREASRLRVKVVDSAANESPSSIAESILRELAAAEPEVEVAWSGGERRVVRPLTPQSVTKRRSELPRGGTWVVTGGGRGITAIAARELAKRYGWKLHLIGKSPAPLADAPWRGYDAEQMKSLKSTMARAAVAEGRSPSEAWDRVLKDVEIFNNLESLRACGIQVTYHSCDIGDREALAAVLEAARRQDGPIEGVLHGAGIIDPSRYESKRRDLVTSQIRTKFDGTINLMALTLDDPLRFFVGFGSISGRFGGNGLTDYAAGNDAMAKVIDWFRARRADCASGCIHWESWEGAGMATVPRYAFGPRAVMNMKYMLPEEGVCRLEQELAAGLPEAEVLYTFGDFYPMFYPHEQRPLGEFMPDSIAQLAAGDTQPSVDAQKSPLLIDVRHNEGSTVARIPLDPATDPFLVQHRLRNKPLLPVVVGLEALAEAATLAAKARPAGFRNVQMLDGLHFHADRSVTAEVRATPLGSDRVECLLTCDFRNRAGEIVHKSRPYLKADVDVSGRMTGVEFQLPAAPTSWTEFSYPENSPVYHGPAFRGVFGVAFDRAGGWGKIRSLPLEDLVGANRANRWIVPSVVLDAALYTCGIHLWMHGEGAISLPKEIEHLALGRSPRTGEVCLAYVECREIGADRATYDFTVVGEDHSVIVAARGYRKVILARGGAS